MEPSLVREAILHSGDCIKGKYFTPSDLAIVLELDSGALTVLLGVKKVTSPIINQCGLEAFRFKISSKPTPVYERYYFVAGSTVAHTMNTELERSAQADVAKTASDAAEARRRFVPAVQVRRVSRGSPSSAMQRISLRGLAQLFALITTLPLFVLSFLSGDEYKNCAMAFITTRLINPTAFTTCWGFNQAAFGKGFSYVCNDAGRELATQQGARPAGLVGMGGWGSMAPFLVWAPVSTAVYSFIETIGMCESDLRVIRSVKCAYKFIHTFGALCQYCSGIKKQMGQRIMRAEKLREAPPNKHETFDSLLRDPDRTRQILAQRAAETRSLQQKNRRQAQILREEKGIELAPGPERNDLDLAIIAAEKEGLAELAKQGFDETTLQRMIFEESVENSKKCSAFARRYSPVTIKFALGILASTSREKYNSLRKTYLLPSREHLGSKRLASAEDSDGPLDGIMAAMSDVADTLRVSEWGRRGALSFDAMKLRSGVYWSAHTKKIIGYDFEEFEDGDVMKRCFQELDNQASGQEALPTLATDYLVFFFSAFDPNVAMRFPVARYCLSGVSPCFLVRTIPLVLASLDSYGFVGVSVTGDGAGENRAAFKALATEPASSFIVGMLNCSIEVQDTTDDSFYWPGTVIDIPEAGRVTVQYADAGRPNESFNLTEKNFRWAFQPEVAYHDRHFLPFVDLCKKVAFKHPTRPGAWVFIWQDMPHWVKRVVNALENSNENRINRRAIVMYMLGAPVKLSLSMIHTAWLAMQQGVGSLRMSGLSLDCFVKNAYSRMRVGLAVKAVSDTAVRIMRAYTALCAALGASYEPLVQLCVRLNRIVDIFNARGDKRVEMINTPNHAHLHELLETLSWFGVWRNDLFVRNLDLDVCFFPRGLWEDLESLVLGIVCLCRFYLKDDGSLAICQRRGDQDCCEHHFAHLRSRNNNPGAYQARSGTAIGADLRVNQAGSGNSASAPVDAQMAQAAVPSRRP